MSLPSYPSEFDLVPDSTTCDIFPTDQGWRVLVRLPRRIPLRERQDVLEWLYEYRAEVRRQHPLWMAKLIDRRRELILDFLVADTPRQALSHAVQRNFQGEYEGSDYGSF